VIQLQNDACARTKLAAALVVHADPWANAPFVSAQDGFSHCGRYRISVSH
jgi:hypothetical protein